MSTEPETEPGTTEETEPESLAVTDPGDAGAGAELSEAQAEPAAQETGEATAATELPEAQAEPAAQETGDATTSAELSEAQAEPTAPETGAATTASEPPDAQAEPAAQGTSEATAAAELSEAQAELAAQKAERERIERRKAERSAPIASGAKLSGKAADLLAAVRAVEGGQKPAAMAVADPAPAPRGPAPEPVRPPRPATPPTPAMTPGPAPAAVDSVRAMLAVGGVPESLAPQIADVLGEGAQDRLRADPWQLLQVAGVRPEQADGFARALLGAECGPDDERRVRALTGWLLEQAAAAGHTAVELPALTAALGQRGVPDPDEAVQSVLAEGEALVFQDALEEPGAVAEEEDDADDAERPVRVLVGLERYALAEESLADGLARLVNSVPKESGPAEAWEAAAVGARGSAAELIRAVAAHGLVLHTGGRASLADPVQLLHAASGAGLRAWAVAHTDSGRAGFTALLDPAVRPDPAVATLAGMLSGAEGPGRDADGALDLDLLIVLDAPQLDVESAALLVESMPDGARLLLAGDPAVLWSAGPGRVFADLLAARVCPQVASRVPDPGPLGELVSGIGFGELNQVEAPGKEIVIVPVRDAGEAVHRTVQLVADSVPRAIGVPADQTVVITPGHGGSAGTRALNTALKERLNPGPGRFGGFDPGDRVVCSPAPGRALAGRVVKADAEGLHLSCAGGPVVVPRERVEQSVRHGWALTAHQAAGGSWPAVVVVLPGDAVRSLSRPWVYTAFSRATRHLSVVHGVEQALAQAVADISAKPRTTRLRTLLEAQVAAAG